MIQLMAAYVQGQTDELEAAIKQHVGKVTKAITAGDPPIRIMHIQPRLEDAIFMIQSLADNHIVDIHDIFEYDTENKRWDVV